MVEEVSIKVSDLHSEMFTEIKQAAGERQMRRQTETFIHNLYQKVEAQKEQQFKATEATTKE